MNNKKTQESRKNQTSANKPGNGNMGNEKGCPRKNTQYSTNNVNTLSSLSRQTSSNYNDYNQCKPFPNSDYCNSSKQNNGISWSDWIFGTQSYNIDAPIRLTNASLNCYLNSALQALSACTNFVNELDELLRNHKNLDKLKTLNNLIQILHHGERRYWEISQNAIFDNWNKYGQQDSFELLSYVVNQVFKEIRTATEKKRLADWLAVRLPLRIVIEYEIKCCIECNIPKTNQSDLALHVAIPTENRNKQIVLQTLLDGLFVGDKIEQFTCCDEQCDGSNAIRITRLCPPLPNTICIQLQRVAWNDFKLERSHAKVDFGNEIIMRKDYFTHEGDPSIEVSDEKYQLKSVIVHHGHINNGHYICYKLFKGNWFYTSDSSIHEVELEAVLKCQAYILFYEKKVGYRDRHTQTLPSVDTRAEPINTDVHRKPSATKNLTPSGQSIDVDNYETTATRNHLSGISTSPVNNRYRPEISPTFDQSRNLMYPRNWIDMDNYGTTTTRYPLSGISASPVNSFHRQEMSTSYERSKNLNNPRQSIDDDNDDGIDTICSLVSGISISAEESCDRSEIPTNDNYLENLSNPRRSSGGHDYGIDTIRNPVSGLLSTSDVKSVNRPEMSTVYDRSKNPNNPKQSSGGHDYGEDTVRNPLSALSTPAAYMLTHALSSCTILVERLKVLGNENRNQSIINGIISVSDPSNYTPFQTTNNVQCYNSHYRPTHEIMIEILDTIFGKRNRGGMPIESSNNPISGNCSVMLPFKSTIKCECGQIDNQPVRYEIGLPLTDDVYGLQSLIDGFFEKKLITQFNCIDKICKIKKGSQICKLRGSPPDTICIYLKKDRYYSKKMSLNFEIILKESFFKLPVKSVSEIKDFTYVLKSVISTEYDRSYTCHRIYNNKWLKITNLQAREVDQIMVTCANIDILFFEKKKNIPKKPVKMELHNVTRSISSTIDSNTYNVENTQYQLTRNSEVPKTSQTPLASSSSYPPDSDISEPKHSSENMGNKSYLKICLQAISNCPKLMHELRNPINSGGIKSKQLIEILKTSVRDNSTTEIADPASFEWNQSSETGLFLFMYQLLLDVFENWEENPLHFSSTIGYTCTLCDTNFARTQPKMIIHIPKNDVEGSLQQRIDRYFSKQLDNNLQCRLHGRGIHVPLWKVIELCDPPKKTICICVNDLCGETVFEEFLLIQQNIYQLVSILSRGVRGKDDNSGRYFCCMAVGNDWFVVGDDQRISPTEISKVLTLNPCILFYELVD